MDASVGAEFDDAASDGFIELGGGRSQSAQCCHGRLDVSIAVGGGRLE
jgi:hypothetical protein